MASRLSSGRIASRDDRSEVRPSQAVSSVRLRAPGRLCLPRATGLIGSLPCSTCPSSRAAKLTRHASLPSWVRPTRFADQGRHLAHLDLPVRPHHVHQVAAAVAKAFDTTGRSYNADCRPKEHFSPRRIDSRWPARIPVIRRRWMPTSRGSFAHIAPGRASAKNRSEASRRLDAVIGQRKTPRQQSPMLAAVRARMRPRARRASST